MLLKTGRPRIIFNWIMSLVLFMLLYVLIHETGHLIVMLAVGAEIDEFSILKAHVSSHGGDYTPFTKMLMQANGTLLPLLLSYVYMLLYRKDSKSSFYRLFSFYAGLIPSVTMLAWVMIPFAFMKGKAPAGDDTTDFLFAFTQYGHPLIVSAVAAILMMTGFVLIVRKGIPNDWIDELKAMRRTPPAKKEQSDSKRNHAQV